MLEKKFNHNRIKKPYDGKNRNRSGRKKKTTSKRNPLVLPEFYEYVRDWASLYGCEAHHFVPKSKLKQDIFLTIIKPDEHREIHAGGGLNPAQWAEEKGYDVLVNESMTYFYKWCVENDMPDEYLELIEDLKNNPNEAHNIAREFILMNRSL